MIWSITRLCSCCMFPKSEATDLNIDSLNKSLFKMLKVLFKEEKLRKTKVKTTDRIWDIVKEQSLS